MTQLTPYDEDPIVHDLLSNLRQYSPSAGFADRVMSQVWRPTPTWVQSLTHACGRLFNPRRAWVIVGSLAATSAFAMVAMAVAAVTYRVQVEAGWSAMLHIGTDAWRFGVQSFTGFAVSTMRWIEPFALDQSMLVALIASSTVVLALSALGLQRTIRQYRQERIPVHARR